jgi:hypothetical protein
MASGAVLFVASAGVASAETVSNKKYATTYCDAIEGWLDQLNEVESEAQTASDGASFQAAAVAAVDSLLASLQTAQESLQEMAPKDGGKKVAKQFDAVLTGQAASIQTSRDAFAATDPDSGAFSEAVGTLLVSGVAAADTFDQPLSQLGRHKALRRAVKQECNIVRVTRS